MHATIVPPKIAAALESGQLVDGVKPESPVLKEVRTFPILIVLQNARVIRALLRLRLGPGHHNTRTLTDEILTTPPPFKSREATVCLPSEIPVLARPTEVSRAGFPMTSSHKNGKSGERKKNRFRKLQQVRITFDEVEVKLTKSLGDGDLRRGIHRAIVLASLRSSTTNP